MLFCDGTAPASIRKLLDSIPLVVDGEFELYGTRFPIIRSQPIPHPFKWNDPPIRVELYYVRLDDFGHGIHSMFTLQSILNLLGILAQWTDREPTTRTISACGLRAPEVILGADFDAKVDVWSLGCMVS